MGSKWFSAGILLALASLILGWLFGMPKIASMENDIRSSLDAAGYENVDVDMRGNVAALTGNGISAADRSGAVKVAENTECSACKSKRRWHAVRDDMNQGANASADASVAKAAPVVAATQPAAAAAELPMKSPYTLSGVKDASGVMTLNGYLPSSDAKTDVLAHAASIFDGDVVDNTIRLASGAPEGFVDASKVYLNQVASLETGRFSQENTVGHVFGMTGSTDTRARVNSAASGLPANFKSNYATFINVPNSATDAMGTVGSKTICQRLFDDVKGKSRINFASGKSNITGGASFDLLNKVAAAANQCGEFKVEVNGYTDSVGDAGYNQRLSEARARTVVSYLATNDVEVARLTAIGHGEDNPIGSNTTPEGRAQNRRITFTVSSAQ